MTKQPQVRSTAEALRLADLQDAGYFKEWRNTAAELRRLHEVNQELLEALKQSTIIPEAFVTWHEYKSALIKRELAIAKAGEQP